MELNKRDVENIDNILKSVRKFKISEIDGEEALGMAQAYGGLINLRSRIDVELQTKLERDILNKKPEPKIVEEPIKKPETQKRKGLK